MVVRSLLRRDAQVRFLPVAPNNTTTGTIRMKEALLMKLVEKLLDCESTEAQKDLVYTGLERVHVGEYVIVRTHSAGVHIGQLMTRKGKEVLLDDARRIWSWAGAFTLSKIAKDGVGSGKLSVRVDGALLTEAIEVLPLSDAARANLYEIKAHD